MYTGPYDQGSKNSCGAATLVIAAQQLNKIPQTTDLGKEIDTVYDAIRDGTLTKLIMPAAQPDDYISPPANILKKAADYKLNAVPYLSSDLNLPKIDKDSFLLKMKAGYIDSTHPAPQKIDPQSLLLKLNKHSFLMLLVYLDQDIQKTHWVLMQADDSGKPFIYDTAFGSNQEASLDNIKFDAQFTTGNKDKNRKNNFLGYAIFLQ